MTLNNKILQLPSDQLSWLLLTKDIFKREFNRKGKREFIDAVKNKAIKKDFKEIGTLMDTNDIEEYFNN